MRQILYHLTHAAHLLLGAKKELEEAIHIARDRRLPRRLINALRANINSIHETRGQICHRHLAIRTEIEEQERTP